VDTVKSERGFVLPAVMFSLAIMAVIAVVAFQTADDERRATHGVKESTVALYAADAGLRNTLGAWPTAAETLMARGDSLHLASVLLSNKSSYQATIHRVDNGGLQVFAVVVYARGPGADGARSTVVGMVSAVPTFRWGLYSAGNIVMSGGSSTDGFNSANGTYATTMDSGGSVATNANVSMSGGSTIIKGDATAAGTVSGAPVTGTTTQNAPPFPAQPIQACPGTGYTPAANVPTGSGISYNATTGVLSVSGGKIVTLTPPPSTFYFSQVVLSGGSQLINAGAVNIIIDTKLDLSGGTVVNPSGVASNLAISSCGANTTAWTLSGGSGAYLTLYAPNHAVTVSGSGDIYGAMVVGSYTSSGGSKLHYDEALQNAPSRTRVVLNGSWAQLSAN
jgi:hypothetical protein